MQSIGPYRVLELVARGGMGVVYRARDEAAGRDVAIKTLRVRETKQRQRFLRECHALAQIRHPNVMPCYAAGEHEGEPYLVLPFLQGESLADRVQRGPLPVPEVARIGAQLADALEFLHGRGILHRDLKPDNVLFDETGAPLLGDFGLVKLDPRDGPLERLTVSGVMIGTPNYWPPEQAQGKLQEIGPASDVYGLGATLYCALTGEPPHAAQNLAELVTCLDRPPTPPSRLRPGIDSGLNRMLLDCLAPEPELRPSAGEVAAALHAFAEQGAIAYRSRRSRAPVIGALLAGVLALGSVIGLAFVANQGSTPVASSDPEPPAEDETPAGPPRWAAAFEAGEWTILGRRAQRGELEPAELVGLRDALIEVGVQQPLDLDSIETLLGLLGDLREAGAPAYGWEPQPYEDWRALLAFDPAWNDPRADPALRLRRRAEALCGAVIRDVQARGPYQFAQPPMFPVPLEGRPVALLQALTRAGLPLGDRWHAEILPEFVASSKHPIGGPGRWQVILELVKLGAHVNRELYPSRILPDDAWAEGTPFERLVSAYWRQDGETLRRAALDESFSPGIRAYAAKGCVDISGLSSYEAMLPVMARDAHSPFTAILLARSLERTAPDDPRIVPLYRNASIQALAMRGLEIHVSRQQINQGILHWPRTEVWVQAAHMAAKLGHLDECDHLLGIVRQHSEWRYLRIAIRIASVLRDRGRLDQVVADAELALSRAEDTLEHERGTRGERDALGRVKNLREVLGRARRAADEWRR